MKEGYFMRAELTPADLESAILDTLEQIQNLKAELAQDFEQDQMRLQQLKELQYLQLWQIEQFSRHFYRAGSR